LSRYWAEKNSFEKNSEHLLDCWHYRAASKISLLSFGLLALQGQPVKNSLLSFGLVQPGNVFLWAEGGVVGADDENKNIFSRAGGWP
jgi:hypothetical protein